MTTKPRRIARPLASAFAALVIGVVTMRVADTGAVVSAASDPATPEIGYSGDHGPGFWGETPGWRRAEGPRRPRDSRQSTSITPLPIRVSGRCVSSCTRRLWT